MVTLAGTENKLIDVIDSLMKLDLDAMEGYDYALGQVEGQDLRETLEQFKEDHVRHADELAKLLAELGGKPNTGPAAKEITADPVVSASVTGDRSILERLLSSEEDTVTAYERAQETAGEHQAAAELLKRNLEDERRHRAWITDKLASL